MSRLYQTTIVTFFIMLMAGPAAFGVQRVAPRLNVMEGFGGYTSQLGTQSGTIMFDFEDGGTTYDLDATDVYNTGAHFGIGYGVVKNRHWMVSAGFRYTQYNFQDTAFYEDDQVIIGFFLPETPTFVQYDLDINVNYQLMDLREQQFSPYVGLGISAGISSAKFKFFDNVNQGTLALGVNFGADVKIWSNNNDGSFVTLASINKWDFAASNNRPKLLQVGGGLRYYFRP